MSKLGILYPKEKQCYVITRWGSEEEAAMHGTPKDALNTMSDTTSERNDGVLTDEQSVTMALVRKPNTPPEQGGTASAVRRQSPPPDARTTGDRGDNTPRTGDGGQSTALH